MFTSAVYHANWLSLHIFRPGRVLLVVLFCWLLLPRIAMAENTVPVVVGRPGDVLYEQYLIRNSTAAPQQYQLSVIGANQPTDSEETGLPLAYSAQRWVTTETSQFTLLPKSQKLVTFTISIPSPAEPGLHPITILAEHPLTSDQPHESFPLTIQVLGSVHSDVSLLSLRVPPRYEWGQSSFLNILVRNSGTTRSIIDGTIRVDGWKRRDTIEIAKTTVLAEDQHSMQVPLPGNLRPGPYWVSGALRVVNAEGSTQITLPQRVVWVLPTLDLLSVSSLLGALFVGVLGVRYLHRLRTLRATTRTR
jgi:hypothetical protein